MSRRAVSECKRQEDWPSTLHACSPLPLGHVRVQRKTLFPFTSLICIVAFPPLFPMGR